MNFDREQDRSFLRAAAKALQDENARLRSEREMLVSKNAEQIAALDDLSARHAALLSQREELLAEVERLEREMRLLQELLDRRERSLYGRKSERRATGGMEEPPADGDDGETAPAAPQRKRRPGHGRTRQPALPVTEVTSKLDGDGLVCQHCNGTLEPLGHAAEIAELISLEERKIVLERHLRTKYQCPTCHTGVVTAPGPVKLLPGGRYALPFAVEVAYQKYMAHMPLDRQVRMFRHDGLLVTTAALWDQTDALATTLTPTYLAIIAAIQAEPVLHADETPWDVLSNGRNANERFYAWVVVGQQYVGFRLLDTRSKDGAATILGAFAGTLMVDGLTSYPAAAKGTEGEEPRFKVANCHAHARRKFVECEAHYPEEAAVALDLYKELYEVERRGKEPGADLAALRDQESRPLIDLLFSWATEQLDRADLLPKSGLANALNYLKNHEAGLRVFLSDPAVAIDNNLAERSVRGLVLGRKNYYCSRSRRGTEAAAILYTLVESAKSVGVAPKAYIMAAAEHALRRAGAVLLPDEFKRQLDAVTPPEANTG